MKFQVKQNKFTMYFLSFATFRVLTYGSQSCNSSRGKNELAPWRCTEPSTTQQSSSTENSSGGKYTVEFLQQQKPVTSAILVSLLYSHKLKFYVR